jgi:hypothetical protein
MRITTIDLDEDKACGIDVPPRRLAASHEPLEAASWQKILELVTHLQSSGSEHELWGQIMLQRLNLLKRERPDPARDREMQEFMGEWFPLKAEVCVSVWVDWRDYAPLRDGLPELHYRFQVKRPGKTLTEDARAKDLMEAERIICEAFGW